MDYSIVVAVLYPRHDLNTHPKTHTYKHITKQIISWKILHNFSPPAGFLCV